MNDTLCGAARQNHAAERCGNASVGTRVAIEITDKGSESGSDHDCLFTKATVPTMANQRTIEPNQNEEQTRPFRWTRRQRFHPKRRRLSLPLRSCTMTLENRRMLPERDKKKRMRLLWGTSSKCIIYSRKILGELSFRFRSRCQDPRLPRGWCECIRCAWCGWWPRAPRPACMCRSWSGNKPRSASSSC